MPFESEAQRRFMHARHPGIAKKWEKHTPKGKLPEKKKARQKAAFFLGFYAALAKEASIPLPDLDEKIKRIMEQLRSRSEEFASTKGKEVDVMPPIEDARTATRMKLDILRDPLLTKEERNALVARLENRPEKGGPGSARILLGAGMPEGSQDALRAYLAAKRSPSVSPFLERVLRLGVLAANSMRGGYRITDRRPGPESERYSQWKMSYFD